MQGSFGQSLHITPPSWHQEDKGKRFLSNLPAVSCKALNSRATVLALRGRRLHHLRSQSCLRCRRGVCQGCLSGYPRAVSSPGAGGGSLRSGCRQAQALAVSLFQLLWLQPVFGSGRPNCQLLIGLHVLLPLCLSAPTFLSSEDTFCIGLGYDQCDVILTHDIYSDPISK